MEELVVVLITFIDEICCARLIFIICLKQKVMTISSSVFFERDEWLEIDVWDESRCDPE